MIAICNVAVCPYDLLLPEKCGTGPSGKKRHNVTLYKAAGLLGISNIESNKITVLVGEILFDSYNTCQYENVYQCYGLY